MFAVFLAIFAILPAYGGNNVWVQVETTSVLADAAEKPADQPKQLKYSVEELLERGKKAFISRDFEACVSELETLVVANHEMAIILTADALYAQGGKDKLALAQALYFRMIYEFAGAPFKDHCYFRIAEIYQEQGNPFEGKLYFRQTLKKFPESEYVSEAATALFIIAEGTKSLKSLKEWASVIFKLEEAPEAKAYVHYISFIYQKTRIWDADEVRNVFFNNRHRILRFPDVIKAYATRFKDLNLGENAKDAFLDVVNFHPGFKGKTQALYEVASYEKEKGQIGAAVFLFKILMESGQDSKTEARAMIKVSEMIAQSQIASFKIMGRKWGYTDLLTAIRFSALPPRESAPFVYRQALLQAVSDPPSKALLTLRQLTAEYKEGPYSSLYRDSYKAILHQTIAGFYKSKRYWDLDKVYHEHRFYLEHSTETQYPHMMAKAYLEIGLTAPARDVFEAMWREKEKTDGFELAFEEPFVDYFLLLNDLKLDDFLSTRLAKYQFYYADQGRYYGRFLLALTAHELRVLEPLDVVERAKKRPVFVSDAFDAQRLQLLTLAAQSAQDWEFANELFEKVRAWPEIEEMIPFLFRAARVYEADYLFRIGNYFLAREKYTNLQVDQALQLHERIWADLQLARLAEMKGEYIKSLELYAQVAFNTIPETRGYATFAKRRMEAFSYNTELELYPEGVLLGQN